MKERVKDRGWMLEIYHLLIREIEREDGMERKKERETSERVRDRKKE